MRFDQLLAGVALAGMIATPIAAAAAPAPARAGTNATGGSRPARVGMPVGVTRPANDKMLSIGEGELITLPAAAADVWTSNPGVADVYVANARQIHLFGKEFGESTVFATDRSGAVIYSATVRVAQNSTSLDKMLKVAMPEAEIRVTQVGQIAVLNGTVASPDDSAQAQRLVTGLLNPGIDTSGDKPLKIGVINRLRTATPLQVNLQVKFAEVNRNFLKNIGSNISTIDGTGGFRFGVGSGRGAAPTINTRPNLPLGVNAGTVSGFAIDPTAITYLADGSINPSSIKIVATPGTSIATADGSRTTVGALSKLFGLNLLSALDLGEQNGQVTSLANPNLTALSGETGTFLAGGEIPIPISQGLGAVTIEYKQFGVSLAYTPTVMSDGRISLRVRPEVSQLDYSNAVPIGTTRVPALTTRRAETTVELGSGQSFMIAGLMANTHNNSFEKTPGISDVPVLGALFRSNAFQRSETELVIIITPYLVKPVNGNDIALPTDGYKAPTDLQRVLLGQLTDGQSGGQRPVPTMQVGPAPAPAIGAAAAPRPNQPLPTQIVRPSEAIDRKAKKSADRKGAAPAPGFSIN